MTKFELTPIGQGVPKISARALIGDKFGGPGSSVDDRITQFVAIKLIGERDLRKADSLRTSDGRASKLIMYAIKTGALDFGHDGTIALGDFVAWTWTKPQLREKFADLPVRLKPIELQATATSSSSMTTELSPGTLDACRVELGKARVLLRDQRTELTVLQRELDRLRPLALKYENTAATNKKSAQKKRPPR